MKLKHSKYKNTGILFELLTRQLTSDTITGNQSKSLSFLKKHFNSKTELLKEYKIYHTLATKKYNLAKSGNFGITELSYFKAIHPEKFKDSLKSIDSMEMNLLQLQKFIRSHATE